MMLKAAYRKTLGIVSERIKAAGIRWYLTGKTNLALHGVSVEPSHIGVLVYHLDLMRVLALFSEYERSEVFDLDNGEAQECIIKIDDVDVLVCGEYDHGTYFVVMGEILTRDIDGREIPCFAMEAEREAYKILGIDKVVALIDVHFSNAMPGPRSRSDR